MEKELFYEYVSTEEAVELFCLLHINPALLEI
jgi:hypothetical protein